MKSPFPLLHRDQGSDFSFIQRGGAFDLIYWQIHPCSDSDPSPSRLPFNTVRSLEKRGQNHPAVARTVPSRDQ